MVRSAGNEPREVAQTQKEKRYVFFLYLDVSLSFRYTYFI